MSNPRSMDLRAASTMPRLGWKGSSPLEDQPEGERMVAGPGKTTTTPRFGFPSPEKAESAPPPAKRLVNLTGQPTPGSGRCIAGPKETVENVSASDDPLDVASIES